MITLGSHTLLKVRDCDRHVRLSYVFEDNGACRKALTVSKLRPGGSPTSCDPCISGVERPEVFTGSDLIGNVDLHLSQDRRPGFDIVDGPDLSVIGGGTLTCLITLLEGVKVDATLKSARIANWERESNAVVHILGEGPVGCMLDEVGHLPWGDKDAYPLLKLRRSEEDRARPLVRTRNGATVTSANGALIGVVVALVEGGAIYAVAPILDVMEWHGLHLPYYFEMPAADPSSDQQRQAKSQPAVPLIDIDPRYQEWLKVA